MDKKKIGQGLQKLRGETPRQEVAYHLGIALSTLRMYENGERIPRDEIKLNIANYYGVSVEELFFAHQ
ncbi:helix-turn-helix transcriptional regulator [Halobacillus shinanisalinarum]|uniref:Helix-turn-helix transcriptional regulator n=1 Tax=Halobacillus shinanisalinarum TaxID=2932258 RepID=A0ABY4H334_9BACI|nr:helix-turn-helix transcriptional regulator [Halobacillus shinanisalinarum]UOQ93382.1 helix-turn-helix transcriptional regulator [Halobacillus shinanisalinarum]